MKRLMCLVVLFVGMSSPAFAFSCAPVPAPVTQVVSTMTYATGSSSVVDPAREIQRDEEMAPLNNYKEQLLTMTDLYFAQPVANLAAGQCAAAWMQVWADGKALLGGVSGDKAEAEFEIRWALSGLAIGYLRIKDAATEMQRASIEAWLDQLSKHVIQKQLVEGRLRNNQYQWTGLALMSTGLALNNKEYIAYARESYLYALGDMDSDGAFPLEMKRKSKALHYQLFTLVALSLMAELSPKIGEDWYTLENGKLFKAIRFALAGLKNPQIVEAKARATQDWSKYDQMGCAQIKMLAVFIDVGPELQSFQPRKVCLQKNMGGDIPGMKRSGFLNGIAPRSVN